MIAVRELIVSYRCALDQVESWMAFNIVAPQKVTIIKINDNGIEATMEMVGSPEAVVEVGNVAGLFKAPMYDLKVKCF